MYDQSERPFKLTTPLGDGMMLMHSFQGHEGISQLFNFELEVIAELGTDVSFDKLLGQNVTLTVQRRTGKRYFSGIVRRIQQGNRSYSYVRYRMELVPKFWLLTRIRRSRIFQQKPVPAILKEVLTGMDVSFEIQGDFKPREYCVQYQETDFAFASRLMEEEGIYYFFTFSDGSHKMVVANTPQSHPDVPASPEVIYEEVAGQHQWDEENRVIRWYKGQEIRSSKFTVWDEHFQLPYKHLEATKNISDSVQVGTVSHKLTAGSNDAEIYEFPGEYSRHFDGIAPGGGEQPDHLQWPFDERTRIAGIRIQQEAALALEVEGEGNHNAFTAGHSFTLTRHFCDNGKFVVTRVEHKGQQPVETDSTAFEYSNKFACIPFSLPYRPQRTTPIPSVRGVQLATVTGVKGEEIFTDKYGRVKVQFHWDREGKNDETSSCWIRVGTFWAGKNWGAIHIPRIGQEVVVGFEEGDVDHPIIVGSVYNADMMPPYTLPDNKTQSGVKSRSTLKGTTDNYNEIRFEDKKGSEEILIHAEQDMTVEVERNRTTHIGKTPMTPGDDTLTVENNLKEKINNSQTTEAVTSIEIKCGQSSIKMTPASIEIKSVQITIDAQVQLKCHSLMVDIEADAMLKENGAITMIN